MTPERLRKIRQSLNHTQHSLAAALGMGRWGWQSISAFEGGRKPISQGFAAKVEQLAAQSDGGKGE